MSETTTGLGEAWVEHFLSTIVFPAGPRRYIPVAVPCPQAGRRSISVAPQVVILGLCLEIPDGHAVPLILACQLVSPP